MSHFILYTIAELAPDVREKFKALCKSDQDYMIDFFTKKLEKPLLKFDINQNDSGKFDSWGVTNVIPAKELLTDFEKFELVPQAILLPNFKLIESEHWFYSVSENNQKDYDQWIDTVKDTLSKHPDSLVALLDCHI